MNSALTSTQDICHVGQTPLSAPHTTAALPLERIQRCCIPPVWGRAPSPVHAERNSAVAGCNNYGFALVEVNLLESQTL